MVMKLIEIERTYQPMAYGRRSKIYLWGRNDDQVIKIYDKGFPVNEILREYSNNCVLINIKGINIPLVRTYIREGNRAGIVFDRIEGTSVMDLMQKKPWKTVSLIRQLCDLQLRLNRNVTSGLLGQEDQFMPDIQTSERLSTKEKQVVSQTMKQLHFRDAVCHGDFHHGNVIVTKNVWYVIDWMDAFSGNPLLDAALTAVNAVISSSPEHIPHFYRSIYHSLRNLPLDRLYLRWYGAGVRDSTEQEVIEKDLTVQDSTEQKANEQDALFVASAIHLVRSRENSISRHRSYFEKMWRKIEDAQ